VGGNRSNRKAGEGVAESVMKHEAGGEGKRSHEGTVKD
jgi:hypothetical protein